MKKSLVILTFLLLCTCNIFSQQVTKADVDAMLVQVGTTADQITEVYVTNTMVHYTDGSSKKSDATYEASNHNKFDIQLNGIRVIYSPPDKSGIILFFPYSAMKYVMVGKTSMQIHLVD